MMTSKRSYSSVLPQPKLVPVTLVNPTLTLNFRPALKWPLVKLSEKFLNCLRKWEEGLETFGISWSQSNVQWKWINTNTLKCLLLDEKLTRPTFVVRYIDRLWIRGLELKENGYEIP